MSLREEFKAWLAKENHLDEESIEWQLMDKPWHDNEDLLCCDDLAAEIESFMWYMSEFAVTKVYGNSPIAIRTSTEGSVEDHSLMVIYNTETKAVLAEIDFGKWWTRTPDSLESILGGLVKQLEKSKRNEAYRSFNFL